MKISTLKIEEEYSLFYLVWFVGIYPFLVLLNSFDYAAINGLFLVNAALSIVAVLFRVINFKSLELSFVSISVTSALFICCVALLFAGHNISGELENGTYKSVLNYFAPMLISSIGCLSLGYSLSIKRLFKTKLYICFFLPAIFILFHIKGFRLDYSLLKDQSLIGIYLLVGDAMCLSALFLCFKRGLSNKSIMCFIFFAVILYLNNSRASFFVFVSAFLFTIFILSFFRRPLYLIIGLFIFIAFLLSFSNSLLELLSLNNRMAAIFSSQVDYSMNSRGLLFDYGLSDIKQYWFFGNLGGQIESSGRLGGYIHNLLAYWRQFGLTPFLLIATSIFYLSFKFIVYLSTSTENIFKGEFLFIFSLFLLAVSLMIFARSIPYYLLFVSIGISDKFLNVRSSVGASKEVLDNEV
ncbi:O-antigen ligase family protein [Pseudoalteromonas sp. NZS71_1]|uniref:O-antigen ligase family protein n=1 Tax=Pseudoalteromonas sp. NZS71_1 TaxID=2792072 RepID=UPI0018CE9A31|nr:O-antigen ligase family protein [Pseudoalteromonas sp. NZS71_1]MBH0036789.1 O-antigen ligase family protein [Pseudoalteromonas sp. NZS71_1]